MDTLSFWEHSQTDRASDYNFVRDMKNENEAVVTIPSPCPLPLHILRPAGLLLPLFLPQDVVNAPADLLGFFHFPFQRKIPPVERFPLGGQLGILRFPRLYRQGSLADYHANKGRGANPLPLRRVPVPAPVCAALLRWMDGWGGGFDKNAPAGFVRSEGDVLKFFNGKMAVVVVNWICHFSCR